METIQNDMARDFHHPYKPYNIQENFMETVYQTLDSECVGILESPTGTGKSLSLICGALTWLREQKKKVFEEALNSGINELETDEPEWIIEQVKARRRRQFLSEREELEAKLAQIRLKEKSQRDQYLNKESSTVKKRKIHIKKSETEDLEQFLLDDYESDHNENGSRKNSNAFYSAETLALLNQVGMNPMSPKYEENEDEVEEELKIFYSSRTHSQLTQFINELRLPKFPSSIGEGIDNISDTNHVIKHVTLGSRKNLCINSQVQKLGSLTSINERCLELQQSKTPKSEKCEFIPAHENQSLVNSFRDHALATIKDIEDMNVLGKEIGICPYYASRSAIKPSEIITLPYPLLLQKSAREALGINLKGNVVIIDEAHNLMDAISNINGVQISLKQLKQARGQLGTYLQKFKNRLKGKNRVYVAQVIRVIDSLSGYLERQLTSSKPDGIVSEEDLLSGKGIDQINFFKLIRYLQESKLARKVEGYSICVEESEQIERTGAIHNKSDYSTPVLHYLNSLLLALTNPQKEGRFFFSVSQPGQIVLRYLLLDPSTQFQEIVSSARAVILAGGTMSPMSDYTLQLFPYLEESKLKTLSCGHVIPRENLFAWNLSRGPSGEDFEFVYNRRDDEKMFDDLGRALLNICQVVPDGVVVFFPSYNYLTSILRRWSISQLPEKVSLLQRLEFKKHVFQERKDISVDQILQDYARAIDSGHGGLLLSVVGGKMSEGINFSDTLGRCVVIVGLPFPNIHSAEWKAKMEFIEETYLQRLETKITKITTQSSNITVSSSEERKKTMKLQAQEVSRDFYENSCMRAVNQSIGRAIRHQRDYAAIIMIDRRFGREKILHKLPEWIKAGLIHDSGQKNFGSLMGGLSTFFRGKK